jgi:hypothetical protein
MHNHLYFSAFEGALSDMTLSNVSDYYEVTNESLSKEGEEYQLRLIHIGRRNAS